MLQFGKVPLNTQWEIYLCEPNLAKLLSFS